MKEKLGLLKCLLKRVLFLTPLISFFGELKNAAAGIIIMYEVALGSIRSLLVHVLHFFPRTS
jgi:hypothetical protein